MNRRILFLALVAFLPAQHAQAAVARELSQNELRQVLAAGSGLSPQVILATVEKAVEGEIVDIRAFDSDGLCYRVLVMLPDGKLVSVVADAATGQLLPGNSSRAQDVAAGASNNGNLNGTDAKQINSGGNGKSSSKKSQGKAKAKGKSNGKGKK